MTTSRTYVYGSLPDPEPTPTGGHIYVDNDQEANRGRIGHPKGTPGGRWIASILWNGELSQQEQTAMGHLYAAAPELLAAAQAVNEATGREPKFKESATYAALSALLDIVSKIQS